MTKIFGFGVMLRDFECLLGDKRQFSWNYSGSDDPMTEGFWVRTTDWMNELALSFQQLLFSLDFEIAILLSRD